MELIKSYEVLLDLLLLLLFAWTLDLLQIDQERRTEGVSI
jgi:hypothetical protein